MSFKLRCYICLSKINCLDEFLCNNCKDKLQLLHWSNCARCGTSHCYGCENLIEFNNVDSLFCYSSGLPEILVLAKDKNDYNMKLLFYKMFFNEIRNYLIKLFQNRIYDYIIMPALRRERILNHIWHPVDIFDDVLMTLKKENLQFNYYIYRPILLNKIVKQTFIPSNKRLKKTNKIDDQNVFFQSINKKKYNLNSESRILIFDDVLTTGETVLRIKKAFEKNISQGHWDLLTLFRTHQSPKVE